MLAAIQTCTNLKDAYLWATSYCARRETCRQEVVQKLRKAPLTSEELEQLLNRLETEGFINQARYAEAFVRDKFHNNRWGRIKIATALRQKGLEHNEIEEALYEHLPNEEEYYATLLRLLRYKLRNTKGDIEDKATLYKIRTQLFRFGASRGFESRLINYAIQDLLED